MRIGFSKSKGVMRPIIVVLFFLMLIAISHAQEKARGVSPPGSLGRKTTNVLSESDSTGSRIACTASYEEPSGDGVLTEGEKVTITVWVRNFSQELTIRPKLEVLMLPNRPLKPKLKVVFMESVQPGQMATHTESLMWYRGLPDGPMTYRVRAFDGVSGLRSESFDVRFDVRGANTKVRRGVDVGVD